MALVYLNPFQAQLENARQQLATLQMQEKLFAQNLANIRQQIQHILVVIQSYESMAAEQAMPQPQTVSLADLCRNALEAHQGQFITALQVRAYIEQLGFSLDYNNIMAVLHNTLARVGQKGRTAFGTVYASK